MKSIMKVGLSVGAVALATVPFFVFAVVPAADEGGITSVTPPATIDIPTIISTVTSWLFGLLLALATIFIIIAAFLYLTSAGDEEKVKKAKNLIVYAIIAIAIGFVAYGGVALIRSMLSI